MSEVPAMISRVSAKILFAWTILAFVAFAILPARAAPGDLRLERVMLSSGGVGYFEYAAEIEGDAVLALKVRLDQVDDVLKFIVVYDDAGRVGQVRLPGREPLAQAFRDLPFRPEALESPAALLNALRILRARAETVTLPDGLGTTVRHRVSLITPQGMRQFILEQAETVGFVDPELQAQVDEALEAIAQHRVQDSRKLSILAGIAPSARGRPPGSGWPHARPSCCRRPTSTSCSPCRRRSPTSPIRTRPPSSRCRQMRGRGPAQHG